MGDSSRAVTWGLTLQLTCSTKGKFANRISKKILISNSNMNKIIAVVFLLYLSKNRFLPIVFKMPLKYIMVIFILHYAVGRHMKKMCVVHVHDLKILFGCSWQEKKIILLA